MAPAPRLESSELAAEMAEVYAMALMRDTPFEDIRKGDNTNLTGISSNLTVKQVLEKLKMLPFLQPDATDLDGSYESFKGVQGLTQLEKRRRKARFCEGKLDGQELFRGSVPGAKVGPYISQLLLLGNGRVDPEGTDTEKKSPAVLKSDPGQARLYSPSSVPLGVEKDSADDDDCPDIAKGYINYGAQRIDQRVLPHEEKLDYMVDWRAWLDVQNGGDFRGIDKTRNKPRFIGTPRDLATFVHIDQLYQAYLNACLLLLEFGLDLDYGFPSGPFFKTRSSFATFGGPHILALVTEVSSRALKAVRRQKFNHHLRLRPEALGGVLTLVAHEDKAGELGKAKAAAQKLYQNLEATGLLGDIAAHNKKLKPGSHGIPDSLVELPKGEVDWLDEHKNYLLPMAFPEGSPMHPAYGAGHATVAGACTTILKAYFELYKLPEGGEKEISERTADFTDDKWWKTPVTMADLPKPREKKNKQAKIKDVYVAPRSGDHYCLETSDDDPCTLTVKGEINKLAANIAIGRNMAGVHYYTDYYDSLRLGERVAVGILQEQMVTIPEPAVLRFETFDEDRLLIQTTGEGTKDAVTVHVWNPDNTAVNFEEWWKRDVEEFQAGPGGTERPDAIV